MEGSFQQSKSMPDKRPSNPVAQKPRKISQRRQYFSDDPVEGNEDHYQATTSSLHPLTGKYHYSHPTNGIPDAIVSTPIHQPIRVTRSSSPHHSHRSNESFHIPPGYAAHFRRSIRTSRTTDDYTSVKEIFQDFCARTSSHGIPFVGARSFFGPYIWITVFFTALLVFLFQTYLTMSDYLEYRTIIEMQLKFEPAPFPAATVCNLNAFKASELRQYEEIEQGFQVWERAMNTIDLKAMPIRKKRHVVYQPVYVRCVCNLPDDQCVPQRNPLETNTSVCMCFEDATTGDIWPCYPTSVWEEKTCYHCSKANTCDDPDRPPNITSLITEPKATECLCQSVSHYCVTKPEAEVRWWNPNNYTVFPVTEPPTPSPEIENAFGLADLKDRGAITTKTKENLIFIIAAMPRETRRQLSYTLDEFVLRCSFNSEDCDLKRDFQIHMDPEFGNCYTFNFNDSVELKNSRAGPMYGLRLLLNVNQSDYMPTTEAAGIRLVVHEQDQEPFPDTFGYSAPTGFVSSFGLKTKVLHRLNEPYGQCSDTFRPEGYIYAEHYSPEGCYRNCFQHMILGACGCGDPRFPLPTDKMKPCDARNHGERACLTNMTNILGGFHHLTHDCHCVQPCTENVFETAYSAAAWPAINFNIGADCPAVLEIHNDSKACAEYYRLNTAYIEIYYEQLNFETLKETAGYTLVNLFSDFGGNIGLWIGFSVITMLEVIELVCELIVYAGKQPQRLIRRKRKKKLRDVDDLPPPRIRSKEGDESYELDVSEKSDSQAPLVKRSPLGVRRSQTTDTIETTLIEP